MCRSHLDECAIVSLFKCEHRLAAFKDVPGVVFRFAAGGGVGDQDG
jgi:hypothetical protein